MRGLSKTKSSRSSASAPALNTTGTGSFNRVSKLGVAEMEHFTNPPPPRPEHVMDAEDYAVQAEADLIRRKAVFNAESLKVQIEDKQHQRMDERIDDLMLGETISWQQQNAASFLARQKVKRRSLAKAAARHMVADGEELQKLARRIQKTEAAYDEIDALSPRRALARLEASAPATEALALTAKEKQLRDSHKQRVERSIVQRQRQAAATETLRNATAARLRDAMEGRANQVAKKHALKVALKKEDQKFADYAVEARGRADEALAGQRSALVKKGADYRAVLREQIKGNGASRREARDAEEGARRQLVASGQSLTMPAEHLEDSGVGTRIRGVYHHHIHKNRKAGGGSGAAGGGSTRRTATGGSVDSSARGGGGGGQSSAQSSVRTTDLDHDMAVSSADHRAHMLQAHGVHLGDTDGDGLLHDEAEALEAVRPPWWVEDTAGPAPLYAAARNTETEAALGSVTRQASKVAYTKTKWYD
jgi:hypothetical protein